MQGVSFIFHKCLRRLKRDYSCLFHLRSSSPTCRRIHSDQVLFVETPITRRNKFFSPKHYPRLISLRLITPHTHSMSFRLLPLSRLTRWTAVGHVNGQLCWLECGRDARATNDDATSEGVRNEIHYELFRSLSDYWRSGRPRRAFCAFDEFSCGSH